MPRFIVPLLIAASILSAPALAQEAKSSRYTMEKTVNGFVRLDTLTGEMSLCVEQSGQIVCKLAADERRAFEETLSDLSARVAALEQSLAAGGLPGAGVEAPRLPDDAEVERALGVMETVMRRFFGMVDELKKNIEPEAPPAAVPDRT